MKTPTLCALTLTATFLAAAAPHAQQGGAPPLKPTSHPRLPADLAQFWLVPGKNATATPAMNDLAAAVKFEVDGNFTRALPMLEQAERPAGRARGATRSTTRAFAELRLGRPAEARKTFQALGARAPVGFLAEAAQMREAESAEVLGDQASALAIYERLAKTKTTAPDDVLMRLGRAAKATGATEKAIEAFSRVLYEFPFGDLAPIAESELQALPIPPLVAGSNRYKLELGRGERLFGARRYAPARVVFDNLRAGGAGRRPRAGAAAPRGVRLLPEESAPGARRRPPVHRQGVAPGRGALLLRGGQPRSRRSRRVPARRAPAGRRVPDADLGRGSAEQPRHALHPPERRRERRPGVPRAVREVPDRTVRGTRRVEAGMVGVQERPSCRCRARLRVGGGAVPALRLPAVVAVLVGARARDVERGAAGRRALSPRRHRLSEQLLRPPGGEEGRRPGARCRSSTSRRRRSRCRPTSRSCARC